MKKVKSVESIAVLFFVVILLFEGVTGLPLRYWILKAMMYVLLPIMGILCSATFLVFLLGVFYVLLPIKGFRRRCIAWLKEKSLKSNNQAGKLIAFFDTFYIVGGIVFVIGVSLAIGLGSTHSLEMAVGENKATLIMMFGSFLLQVILATFAILIYFNPRSKEIRKVMLRG